MNLLHKTVLLGATWMLMQACTSQHYSRSMEHDDLYFTTSDNKKWQVKNNPSYDANYKTPAPTQPVVDPNEYQFSSGSSVKSNNVAATNTSTAVTQRNNSNRSRIQTNFTVGTMFGPGGGYNSYNSFNVSWFYSNYYGYNSYWSPYSYTPYYCNTYINPYAGFWYSPYAMPMYPNYGYGNYGYYDMYGNYGYNNNYGYYNNYPPMYYQPPYMSYPSYYTPQGGYNTVTTPKSAPRTGVGSSTGNSNYPSGSTTTTSPYQNKSYTPSTSSTQPNTTQPRATYPRGSQSPTNNNTQQQYNPSSQQPRQSYTPQNSYHPPQQSHSPSHNYNPSPRGGGGGGGSAGTPNPRMR